MPRGQPFTALCQLAARLRSGPAADLHAHTTASDGDYTPSQLVAFALQARLAAVAVTDHDTVAGVADAVAAARAFPPGGLVVVPGVEMSVDHAGRGLHVLGLFVNPDDPALAAALRTVCDRRRERFRLYLERFAGSGVVLPPGLAEGVEARTPSLGRRHLAGLLVQAGAATSRFDAFRRYLGSEVGPVSNDHALPAAEAILLIRGAGGVASLAHPPADIDRDYLIGLKELGLNAVEVSFPAATFERSERLRRWASELELAVCGGSDCHGPGPAGRGLGSFGVTRDELSALRRLTGGP